jgi:N-acetylglucosamine kinase-like BadF-type ATPase
MTLPLDAPPNRLFLGVDGGGTQTRAVVVDDAGVERAAAQGDGANPHRVGAERAVAAIAAVAAEAARRAGGRLPLTAAWLGLAGLDSPADEAALTPGLASLAAVTHLVNDAELPLSALPAQVGVALIAGTGSIAVGRNEAGAATRVGGWGHTLGDEGSGYALGAAALVAAVRAADGRGEPTILLERILSAWGLDAANQLIARVYAGAGGGATAPVAQVAPIVLQAARAGDALAQGIIQRGAEELALAALTAGRQLGFGVAPLPLALGGSLLLRDAGYRETVVRAISREMALGEVALVEWPALSAARAAITLLAAPAAIPDTKGETHDV